MLSLLFYKVGQVKLTLARIDIHQIITSTNTEIYGQFSVKLANEI